MLTCQKHLFQLDPGIHYLNCAYMSPLMLSVEEAGIAGMRRKRSPNRISPSDFFTDVRRLKQLFARLVNVPDADRIAVIPSASYGISTVARNLPVRKGQHIVLTKDQFPSNVYPWLRLAKEKGLDVRMISPPDTAVDRGLTWNERILEAIDEDTALVALPHVHWTDGTRFHLQKIRTKTKACGAWMVIDGSQSVGALPFDVSDIQPDALICVGYKWMLGPYGISLAYYGPSMDHGIPLEENWMARHNSEDFTRLVQYQEQYEPLSARYDVGEKSNFILIPMMIAAIEQLLAWQPGWIQEYCARLTAPLIDEWRAAGYQIEDAQYRSAHLFGLRLPAHVSQEQLQKSLRDRNVFVSVRGDAVRVAPQVYNDETDMRALVDGCVHI